MEFLYQVSQVLQDDKNENYSNNDSQIIFKNSNTQSQCESGYHSKSSQNYSQTSNYKKLSQADLISTPISSQNFYFFDDPSINTSFYQHSQNYYTLSNDNYSQVQNYSLVSSVYNSQNDDNNYSQQFINQSMLEEKIQNDENVLNEVENLSQDKIYKLSPKNKTLYVFLSSETEDITPSVSQQSTKQFLKNPYKIVLNENLSYPDNECWYTYINAEKLLQVSSIENLKIYLHENQIKHPKTILIEKLDELKNKFLEQDPSNKQNKYFKQKTFSKIIKSSKSNILYDAQYGINIENENFKYKSVLKRKKHHFYYLIDKLKELLENDRFCTIRDIYYQNMKLYKNTNAVQYVLSDIVCTLGVSRHDVNIFAAPKGLVFGDLKLTDSETVIFDGKQAIENGIMIPNNLNDDVIYESNAKFILIVEKFDVFCHLIRCNIGKKYSLILITGCGYPDLRTRHFTQKLWLNLQIPIFCLVDGDAFGVEIVSTYKYGSKASCYENHHLILPELRWIGVTANDIIEFQLQGVRFKENEYKKFASLKKRPYLEQNKEWYEQIVKMEQLGIKVEIQALMDYHPNYLIDNYLPYKLCFGKWV